MDVVSFEFENVSAEGLNCWPPCARCARRWMCCGSARTGWPKSASTCGRAHRPMASEIKRGLNCDAALGALGLPAVLKTTRLGYDGKGQEQPTAGD